MISDDGGEVFAHKIVVSMFSTSMANLFLNQDEVMTTVMVPVSCKTLQDIIKIILGIIDIDEEDLKTAREASGILGIDLTTVVTHDEKYFPAATDCVTKLQNSPKESTMPFEFHQPSLEITDLPFEVKFDVKQVVIKEEGESNSNKKERKKVYISKRRKSFSFSFSPPTWRNIFGFLHF